MSHLLCVEDAKQDDMLRFATRCFLGWLLLGQTMVQAQTPAYEWEIAKHQRWEAHKNRLTDSLMLIHRKRLLFSLGYGNYVVPGFEAATADSNGINIRDGHRVFTVSIARFMTNRLGLELDWNLYLIKQNMTVKGSSIRGGGGVVSTVLIQTKYLFPAFAKHPHTHLYVVAGAGSSQTFYMSIKAKFDASLLGAFGGAGGLPGGGGLGLFGGGGGSLPGGGSPTIHRIPTTTFVIGGGVYHRLGKYLAIDASLRYFYAQHYDEPVGSIRSFSPFQLTTKFSGIAFGGFGRMNRRLRYE